LIAESNDNDFTSGNACEKTNCASSASTKIPFSVFLYRKRRTFPFTEKRISSIMLGVVGYYYTSADSGRRFCEKMMGGDRDDRGRDDDTHAAKQGGRGRNFKWVP
jgi:hypothetical protein